MDHFLKALRDLGIEPIVVNLDDVLGDRKCPVHGDGPCPAPTKPEDLIPNAAEALRVAKVSLSAAVAFVNDEDANKSHLRLAVADTAMELYDRMLAAEIKAEFDEMGERDGLFGAPVPDLRTDTEREADENAARFPGVHPIPGHTDGNGEPV